MELRITDGTTTITLSAGGYSLGCTYFPQTGNAVTLADVQETATVTLSGTPAQILATTGDLELLFDTARRHSTRQGAGRVYVECKANDADDWSRAELRDGDVSWSEEPLRRRLDLTTTTVEVAVRWSREAAWWGPLTAIPISNRNSAGTTSGLRLWGHTDSDAGQDNWADISSSQVAGILPSPAYVKLGAPDVARTWYNFHLINARVVGSLYQHIFECEDASGSGSRVNVAGGVFNVASNNAYRQVQVGSTSEFYFESAAIRNTIAMAAGRDCRLLLRLYYSSWGGSVDPNIFVRAELRTASRSYVLATSDEVKLPRIGPGLVDLGLLQMPEEGGAEISLVIVTRTDIAATVSYDFLQIAPADGYRVWPLAAGTMQTDQYIIDNPYEQQFYKLVGGSPSAFPARPRGMLWLYPEQTQRLFVLCDRSNGFFVDDTYLLQLWYRPRRLTVD